MAKQKPKNGKFFTAFIIGGDKKLRNQLHAKLAAQGIKITEVWEASKNLERKDIPDVDLCLVPRDMSISRNTRDKISYNARKAGVYVIDCPNVSYAIDRLNVAGFEAEPLTLQPNVVPPPEPEPEEKPIPITSPERISEGTGIPYTPYPKPAPAPELPVPKPSNGIRMVAVGAMLKAEREKHGMNMGEIGRAIGMTNGAIAVIEKGGNIGNNVATALERLYSLEPGSIPRLATRDNHRIDPSKVVPLKNGRSTNMKEALQQVKEDTPIKTVIPARVHDRDIVSEIKIPPGSYTHLNLPLIHPPTRADLMLQIFEIQAKMKEYGIERIELTPTQMKIDG